MSNNHSQWNRYGWLAFALIAICLSFVVLRAAAQSSTAAFTPSLPTLMQQPSGCGASFAQAQGSPISVGNLPSSVTAGDFNLDGKPDLAVTNEGTNDVTILLGAGNGGFVQSVDSPVSVGTTPLSVATGDFNLDSKPDLAVANYISKNVTILLGNGSGSFMQAAGSPVSNSGEPPQTVIVEDFNLDGKPDLALANLGFSDVTILLGNGTGGFIQPASAVGTVGGAFSLATSDFNNDGKPDLAVPNQGFANVAILLGNGNGGFVHAIGSPVGVGLTPRSVAVGDFNRDGKPDVAVANHGPANVTILLGNGLGGFTPAAGSPFSSGSRPLSVTVGDFNFDSKPDLVMANYFTDHVTILLGDGNGSFAQAAGSPIRTGTDPYSVAIGDFNLDGKPDLRSD